MGRISVSVYHEDYPDDLREEYDVDENEFITRKEKVDAELKQRYLNDYGKGWGTKDVAKIRIELPGGTIQPEESELDALWRQSGEQFREEELWRQAYISLLIEKGGKGSPNISDIEKKIGELR